jgi:hypothetical protein
MSQKTIKPDLSTIEKIKTQQTIEQTVKQTKKAIGRSVMVSMGRMLFGIGFVVGAGAMALVDWLVFEWIR